MVIETLARIIEIADKANASRSAPLDVLDEIKKLAESQLADEATLAQTAYETYCEKISWKPNWDQVELRYKLAWGAVVTAILAKDARKMTNEYKTITIA